MPKAAPPPEKPRKPISKAARARVRARAATAAAALQISLFE